MTIEPTAFLRGTLCLALLWSSPAWAGDDPHGSKTAAAGAQAPAKFADRATSESLKRVAAVLASGATSTVELLADQLVQLGSAHVSAAFEMLRRGNLIEADEWEGTLAVALDPLQQSALLLALKHMPVPTRNLFQELARDGDERPARVVAVRVLGEIGQAADLRLVLDLARSPKLEAAAPPQDKPVQAIESLPGISDEDCNVFQTAVEKLLARDAESFLQVETLFLVADAQLRPFLVRAITAQQSLVALGTLSHLLSAAKDLDLLLLTEIGKCAGALAPPFDEKIDGTVRDYLKASSADLVREAALAVGRLEDSDALPMLVALLSHNNRGVRQNAHWSLKKISGLCFAADPKAWAPWLEQETLWWRDSAPALFTKLETADLPAALEVVQQIARRRYPRHPLAAELTRALGNHESEVRRLTCVALGQFRSKTALAGLLTCLDDPDLEVRMAAARALRSVTGVDLPPVREAWTLAGF